MSGKAVVAVILLAAAMTGGAWAQQASGTAGSSGNVPMVFVPSLDLEALRIDDAAREAEGQPFRFAIPVQAILRPASDGVWTYEDTGIARWRLRVQSPGAVSINLGFTGYYMPPGGKLTLYATDGSYELEEYTAANNTAQGELWTPIVPSDDIIVEVALPQEVKNELILDLTSINVGYRGFEPNPDKAAGACEIDVKCALGNNWWNEIPATGVISTGGSLICSGSMINNTKQDQTPYFLTAHHCGITSGNAASLVVYWNYQKPGCSSGSGALTQTSTGSVLRGDYATSDFTLVQLNAAPNPTYKVTFEGWDRSGANATSIIGIHHPDTDVKKISYSSNGTHPATYLQDANPGDATHVWVNWLPVATNQGATEPGSSGSPLFDQNHHVIGQLHGGYSACGVTDMRDWYGRLYVSWTGGGTSSTRLSNWLDPNNTGQMSIDTLNPYGGMSVAPAGGLDSSGDPGGPVWTPGSIDYTMTNPTSTPLAYTVTNTQTWISLTNASGTIPASGFVTVNVSINSNANSLTIGTYTDTVTFTNTTNHSGDTTRPVTLHVGGPKAVYTWNMDTNPGWTTQGVWAYGHPTGAGSHNHDPSNGHTGTNVYGYNLTGDYDSNKPAYYLTTTAIDCSSVVVTELRFWRWLGVEASLYDHADVAISTNGTTWTTLWSNPSSGPTADTAWTQQIFDISAVADGQATVYIRWGMGSTDTSVTYPGWNIDDVEIWGVTACNAPTISGQPQGLRRHVGQQAVFSVTAAGPPPPSYQWRKGGINIGGATGSSYTIDPVGVGDIGDYDCVVTNSCGSTPSAAAHLTVWLIGDINCDGVLSFADINPFVLALSGQAGYEAQYPNCYWYNADCNNDGVVSFADINPFVALLAK